MRLAARFLVASALLAVLLMATGGHSLAGSSAVTSAFDDPPNPIDIKFDFDTDAQDLADIGPAGGSLQVTGMDGTVYRLDVPPEALTAEVPISLSAVNHIVGLPDGSGPAYAATMGPEGLQFEVPAQLTITPAQPAPEGALPFAFMATGDGQDVRLAQRRIAKDSITIRVWHFSTVGTAQPTTAAPEFKISASRQRELDALMDAELAKHFPAMDDNPADLSDFVGVFQVVVEDLLPRRMSIASKPGASCEDVRLAIRMARTALVAVVSYGNNFDAELKSFSTAIITQRSNKTFLSNYLKCIKKKAAACEFSYPPGQTLLSEISSYLIYQDQSLKQLNGLALDEAALKLEYEMTKHCYLFHVEFTSHVEIDNECWHLNADVSTEFNTDFDRKSGTIRGRAPLDIKSFSVDVKDACAPVMIKGFGARSERMFTLTIEGLERNWSDESKIDQVRVELDFGKVLHKHTTIVTTGDIDAWRVAFTHCGNAGPQRFSLRKDDGDWIFGKEDSYVGCPAYESPNTFTYQWDLVLTPLHRLEPVQ